MSQMEIGNQKFEELKEEITKMEDKQIMELLKQKGNAWKDILRENCIVLT
jgi:hypothetical protein